MRKKIYGLFLLIFAGFVLVACTNDKVDLSPLVTELSQIYKTGDTETSVTKDLTLKTSSVNFKEAVITWTSSDTSVVSNTGVVTRQDADTDVELSLKITYKKQVENKKFSIKVIKEEEVVPTVNYKLTLGANISSNQTNLDAIKAGTKVVLTITVPAGKIIDKLIVNDVEVEVTNNKYEFNISKATKADVTFKDAPVVGTKYTLTLPSTNVTSNPDGEEFDAGTVITITVSLPVGEEVDEFKVNGVVKVLTNLTYELTLNEDTEVTVTFKAVTIDPEETFTLTLPTGVTSDQDDDLVIAKGTKVTLTVEIPSGKVIDEFKVNGTSQIFTNKSYEFNMLQDTTVVVAFKDEVVVPPVQYEFHETFTGLGLEGEGYGDKIFTSSSNLKWNMTHVRASGKYSIQGEGVTLRRTAENSSIKTTLPNGLSGFTFQYMKAETGGSPRYLEVVVNGVRYEVVKDVLLAAKVYDYVYTGPEVFGEVQIEIRIFDESTNRQITIDNFKWNSAEDDVETFTLELPVGVTSEFTGPIRKDTEVVLTITPEAGYEVDTFKVNGEVVALDSLKYTFIITEDTTIEVTFKEKIIDPDEEFTLTLGNNIESDQGDKVTYDTEVTLTLTVPEGMLIVKLLVNGIEVEFEDLTYVFLMKEDTTVELVLKEKEPELKYFTIILPEGVTSSVTGEIVENKEVTLTVNVPKEQVLDKLLVNDVQVVVINNKYTFKITEDVVVDLELRPVVSEDRLERHETFDTSSATGSYGKGDFIGVNGLEWTFDESRNEDSFGINGKGIMLRGAIKPSSLSTILNEDTYGFSFEFKKAFSGDAERNIEVIVNGVRYVASSIKLDGKLTYHFNYNGPVLEAGTTIIIRIFESSNSQQVVIDNFKWITDKPEPLKYTLELDEGVTANYDGLITEGTEVVLTVDVPKGYKFVSLLVNDDFVELDDNNTYTFTIESNTTVIVEFELITHADVNNEEELRVALKDHNIRTISILDDIHLEDKLTLVHRVDVTINGNNKTLSIDDIDGWQANYILQLDRSKAVEINNLRFEGGDVALLVNGAELFIDNISLSNHEYGGIEVSQGTNVTEIPKLVVEGFILSNLVDLPVVWIDGKTTNDGWVTLEDLIELEYTEGIKVQLWFIPSPDVKTVEEQIQGALDYVYTPGYNFVGLELVENKLVGNYSYQEYVTSKLTNDLARFFGALAYQDESNIRTITFDGVIYTWNEEGTLKGSNWEFNGITLMNAIVEALEAVNHEGELLFSIDGFELVYNVSLDESSSTEVVVSSERQIEKALMINAITKITLNKDITLEKTIVIERDVIIEGNNKSLIKEVNTSWDDGNAYTIHFHAVANAQVNNVKFVGGNAAIFVNGSNVSVSGLIFTNQSFGGIEVAKGGWAGLVDPKLVVNGLLENSFTNLPVVWIDGKTTNDNWVELTGLVEYEYTTEIKTQLWFVNKVYEVKFMIGEELHKTVTVLEGNVLEAIEDPVKEGSTFTGWYLDDVKYDDFGQTVDTDLVLVGKFEESYEETLTLAKTKVTSSTYTPFEVIDSYGTWAGTINSSSGNMAVRKTNNQNIITYESIPGFVVSGIEMRVVIGSSGVRNIRVNNNIVLDVIGAKTYDVNHRFNDLYSNLSIVANDTMAYTFIKVILIKDPNYIPPVEYTISFDSNGGSEVLPITIIEGLIAEKPVNPTLDGFKFLGWFLKEDQEIEYLFADVVNNNIELIAKWEESTKEDVSQVISTFDFTKWTKDQSVTINTGNIQSFFNQITENNIISKFDTITALYKGNSAGGGYEKDPGLLRIGKNGELKVTLTEKISKISIIVGRWQNDSASINVNGQTTNVIGNNLITLDIDFSESQDIISIKSTNRIIIKEIKFYS